MNFSVCLKALENCGEENITNYQFFPMLFKRKIKSSGADSKQTILATITMRVSCFSHVVKLYFSVCRCT